MKKRVKGFLAIIISFLLSLQLVPQELLVVYATEYTVSGETKDISTDMSGDTYVIMGSGATVNVTSTGKIDGVTIKTPDSYTVRTVLNVSSGGTVGVVSAAIDSEIYSSGTISTLTSEGSVSLSGGTVGSLTMAGGSLTVSGSVQVADATLSIPVSGDGTLNVNGSLVYNSTSEGTGTIGVQKNTTITSVRDLYVLCNGHEFLIPAGASGLTVGDMYGYSISANSLSFDTQKMGYTQIASKTFTITNTKTEDLDVYTTSIGTNYNVVVSIAGTSASLEEFSIGAGESATISVTPKTGLAEGSYSESIQFNIMGELNTVSLDFKVEGKMQGKGTASMSDYYYGAKVGNPVIASETNGVGNKTVQYKAYNAADSTYTNTVPTEVGDYTMRVVFAETATYNAVTVTDNFSVIYLPIPSNPYSLQGTKGNNNFYTTAVKLVPAEGYLVATELNGEYKEELIYSSSTYSEEIYFMNIETGAKTDALLISNMLIDTYYPSIADVEEGETYYVDDMEVWVRDANLKTVTLNEEEASLLGNSALLELTSNGGTTNYSIEATDYAGNKTTITFTLASEWTKTGLVPSGTSVRLISGESYKLGSGSWTVSGDSTTYSGGNNFYVNSEGDFTFTQQ